MNKVILMGRLTKDPDCRRTEEGGLVVRYTLAVDRRIRKDKNGQPLPDQQTADFIGCVAFGKSAEHAEKYYKMGTKIVIEGRIQTGSYTNKDGQKVYTTDVIVDNQEFAESKNASKSAESSKTTESSSDGFTPVSDEKLPWD